MHQRALAASRGAKDGKKAPLAQPLGQLDGLLLAAEEEHGVLLLEGFEAAIGACLGAVDVLRDRGRARPGERPGDLARSRYAIQPPAQVHEPRSGQDAKARMDGFRSARKEDHQKLERPPPAERAPWPPR